MNGSLNGYTYTYIMQQLINWFAFSQDTSTSGCGAATGCGGFGYGGWHYSANYGTADGSTNQWPVIAMEAAQSNFGSAVSIPASITTAMNQSLSYTFLNQVHDLSSDGSYGAYGYTTGDPLYSIGKTGGGILANFFLGNSATNCNVLAGIGYMYNNWEYYDADWDYYNLGNSYAMYDVMKAMQYPNPPISRVTQFNPNSENGTCNGSQSTTNSFDWFYTPSGTAAQGLQAGGAYGDPMEGLATVIVNESESQGTGAINDTEAVQNLATTLSTAWDSLILIRAVANIPPQAGICNCSSTWAPNSPITLDGSCSVEPNLNRAIPVPAGYKWDFNYAADLASGAGFTQTQITYPNGEVLPLQGIQATYPSGFASGTHTVALQVNDTSGQTSLTTCNVSVTAPPHCPQAEIGGPYLGRLDPNTGVATVTFDAAATIDIDGDELEYDWDFENASLFTDSQQLGSPLATHTWTANGTYAIELRVTNKPQTSNPVISNDVACSSYAYTTVNIGPHSPVANAGGPYTGLCYQGSGADGTCTGGSPGETITLDASASIDPDKGVPGDVAGITGYMWDLVGNGQFVTPGEYPSYPIPAGATKGSVYDVCVEVVDAQGLTSSPACSTVTVVTTHPAPVCIIAPVPATSCTGNAVPVQVDGSFSYDIEGEALTYAWTSDCGTYNFANPALATPTISLPTADGAAAWNGTPVCSPTCTATLTLTNTSGKHATCSQPINIVDNQSPAFTQTPSNLTVECDQHGANTIATSVPNWVNSGVAAGDVCAPTATPVTIASNFVPSAGCGGVGLQGAVQGAVRVTWTAADPCNPNTSQVSAILTVQDTKPPVLTLPGDINNQQATSASGAVVSFVTSANDAASGPAAVTCVPASGSTFPIGTTTVNCSSTDTVNNTATGFFHVTVIDTTPPTLTAPASASAEATSPAGATVTWSATATDIVDGTINVTCVPASGSTFPLGMTNVSCSTTDAHHNTSNATFTVTVADTTPPVVTVPPNATVEATSAAGAPYNFVASAYDAVSGNPPVTCSPLPGSTFALGTTKVTCTAQDSSGNTGSASFYVTVQDTTPPTFSGDASGGELTVEATSAAGATITDYGLTAYSPVDGPATVTCVPAAPMLFPLGQSSVNCSAPDNHGNTASISITVNVVDTTPPVITCPANITVAANGPLGAQNWNVAEPTSDSIAAFVAGASAVDLVDPSPMLVNNAPWMYPLGESTTVTFTATDAHQNSSSCTAQVTVIGADEEPPSLTCPSSVVLSSGAGAEIDWSAVFQHPVSVTLLLAAGGSGNPLSLAEMGDRSVLMSSEATAKGTFAVRIRATDQQTGMEIECNRFLSVSPVMAPAQKSASLRRSAVPAAPVRF